MNNERIIIEPTAKLVAIPIVAFLMIGLVATVAVTSDRNNNNQREVSFQGEGKIVVKPDVAVIRLGVTTPRAPNAADALRRNTNQANDIITAVRAFNVDEKDVRTSNFSLNPSYDYMEGRQVLRGFDATTELEVKIRSLDKIGEVIAAATSAGANQIGGLEFTLDNPEAMKNAAREKAIAAAKEKARFMARTSGLKLGKLINVSESFYGAPPIYKTYALESRGGSMPMALPAPDIQPGSQDITVNVSLTYRVQ